MAAWRFYLTWALFFIAIKCFSVFWYSILRYANIASISSAVTVFVAPLKHWLMRWAKLPALPVFRHFAAICLTLNICPIIIFLLKGPVFLPVPFHLQDISLFSRVLPGVIRARLTFFALPPVIYRCNNTLKAILALLTYLIV